MNGSGPASRRGRSPRYETLAQIGGRMRRVAMGAALAVLIVSTLGVTVAPEAARAETGTPASTRVYADMVRVGVDHRIAEANGYEVRTDRNGVEYATPKGSPANVDGTVPGPCGTIWACSWAIAPLGGQAVPLGRLDSPRTPQYPQQARPLLLRPDDV